MANKVNQSASIPQPINLTSFFGISDFITTLVIVLSNEFRDHAIRLNKAMVADGTEVPSAPVLLKSYAKASLPSAITYINGMIIVTDDIGGRTPAFSDGTNWRRTADRNIIS